MVGFILTVWFIGALVVGYAGALRHVPTPPPALALLLTILVLGAVWLIPALHRRVQAIGIGPMVAFHLTRFGVGLYFLVLAHRGTLPGEFALVAGWGDIVVGLTVLPVLRFCVPAQTSGQRITLLAWNTLGLVDILIVLANGLRLFERQPEIAQPFTHLPLTILPLFLVPLVISTHLWIFTWTVGSASPLPEESMVRPPEDDDEGDATQRAGRDPRH